MVQFSRKVVMRAKRVIFPPAEIKASSKDRIFVGLKNGLYSFGYYSATELSLKNQKPPLLLLESSAYAN
jgi:hypothetical protein